MKSDFEPALAFVLDAEGGYVDDPLDPGGATNMGIEQGEYNLWRESIQQEPRDIRLIQIAETSAIYKANYWDKVHADYLPSSLAYSLFDTAVNIGCGAAIRILQSSLDVSETDDFDTDTSTALWSYLSSEQVARDLARYILARRIAYYQKIVIENGRLSKFLVGWLNRVDRLQDVINNLPLVGKA